MSPLDEQSQEDGGICSSSNRSIHHSTVAELTRKINNPAREHPPDVPARATAPSSHSPPSTGATFQRCITPEADPDVAALDATPRYQ
jgi:hypothetical protein